jgi:anthranilate phosphoribosyltransferase
LDLGRYLEDCLSRKPLSSEAHQTVFSQIFNQELDGAQTAACLVAWRSMGETSELLVAGAREILKRNNSRSIPQSIRPIGDNCGTGGDGKQSFNISTAAALLAASGGLRIFKHGNRSVSSKCGSADLLFELGVPDTLDFDQSLAVLEKTGFGFLFAPKIHPSIGVVMPVRRQIGIRTIFNLLGPLVNPSRPDFQIIGVARADLVRTMSEAALQLGIMKAAVVHSRDGMDEVSPSAPTDGMMIENGNLREFHIDPAKLKLSAPQPSLLGGDAKLNAQLFRNLLEGTDSGIQRAVVLNAGLLFLVAGQDSDHVSGCRRALGLIQSGKFKEYCDDFFGYVSRLKQGV